MDKQEATKTDAKHVLGGIAVLALIIFVGIKACGESTSSGSKGVGKISGTYRVTDTNNRSKDGHPYLAAFRVNSDGRIYELWSGALFRKSPVIKLPGSDENWLDTEIAAVKPGVILVKSLGKMTTEEMPPKPGFDVCTVSRLDGFDNPNVQRKADSVLLTTNVVACFNLNSGELLLENEHFVWEMAAGIEQRSMGADHCQQGSPIRESYCLSDLLNETPRWWWRGKKEP